MKGAFRFENLGTLNSFAVPSLVLEMKERRVEEFAQQVYETYCGVWHTQWHAKSAAFLRAIFGGAILPALRARGGAIASEFARVAGRASFPSQVRNANLEGLRARMHRLENRWRRQIEAEAKECEHIERRGRSGVQSKGDALSLTARDTGDGKRVIESRLEHRGTVRTAA